MLIADSAIEVVARDGIGRSHTVPSIPRPGSPRLHLLLLPDPGSCSP